MIGPLMWVGGKSKQAKKIISLFPEDYTMYIEPFGGSAAVLLACDHHPEKKIREVYNDINGELVNFFNAVRDNAEEMVEQLAFVMFSRQQQRELLEEYLTNGMSFEHVEDRYERATKFFTLNRHAFSGWIHPANHGWAFSSSPKSWKAQAFRSAIRRMLPLAERFAEVQIEAMPYEYMLKKYDSPTTLFYLDPPYSAQSTRFYGKTETGNDYYNVPWTEEDDIALATLLQTIEGKAVVSYYPCALLDEAYAGWRQETFDATTHCMEATELVLLNYD